MADFLHPCLSLKAGKAQGIFLAAFCLESCAGLLKSSSKFSQVKISPRLNLLKAYGEKEIILFKSGEISAQPFKDKETAQQFLEWLAKLLWPAQLCETSGKAVKECQVPLCQENCWAKENKGISLKKPD